MVEFFAVVMDESSRIQTWGELGCCSLFGPGTTEGCNTDRVIDPICRMEDRCQRKLKRGDVDVVGCCVDGGGVRGEKSKVPVRTKYG
jgi:hypothetical protein